METKNYVDLCTAFIFTTAMVLIPWEELQGYAFVDRKRYIDYFLYQESVLEYKKFSVLVDYVIHEWLWHFLVAKLIHDLGISINTVFLAISAFNLFVFSLFLVVRQGAFSVLLLFNPLLVTFAFDQLRMALAYSLLVVAYMVPKPFLVVMLVLIAVFIHTATILFLAMYIAIKVIEQLTANEGSNKFVICLTLFILGIAVSLVIGPLREAILGYLGDRRANLSGSIASSFLYTSFWVGLLGLFVFQPKSFYENEVNCYSVVILSLVSCNLITGGYTLRFLSAALPMMLVSILNMAPNAKLFGIICFVGYAIFQWLYYSGGTVF